MSALEHLKQTWHQHDALRRATLALHAVRRDGNMEVLKIYDHIHHVLTIMLGSAEYPGVVADYIHGLFEQVEHVRGVRTFYLRHLPDDVSLDEVVSATSWVLDIRPLPKINMPAPSMAC